MFDYKNIQSYSYLSDAEYYSFYIVTKNELSGGNYISAKNPAYSSSRKTSDCLQIKMERR